MFRKLAREKQALSIEECKKILKEEKRGVLSVYGLDGYPYGMPMNFYYDEESSSIYFHGGKYGHKIDAIKKNPKVSFCVFNEGYRNEGEWAYNVKSVIIFGQITEMEDQKKAMDLCKNLSYKYTADDEYIDYEIKEDGPHTLSLLLRIENIQGKLVKEA